MVYMCAGKTTHIINGNKELTLEEGDLLFLNQNVYHEILPSGENDIAVNFIILPEFFDRPPSHDGYDQSDLYGTSFHEPVQICRSDRPRRPAAGRAEPAFLRPGLHRAPLPERDSGRNLRTLPSAHLSGEQNAQEEDRKEFQGTSAITKTAAGGLPAAELNTLYR